MPDRELKWEPPNLYRRGKLMGKVLMDPQTLIYPMPVLLIRVKVV